ncbi:MAG: hypothetical protein J5999_08250 [Oscillospiraceae bacterium]|nr:hypothetical protein [Oscillospiraceae bacterium]
MIAFLTAGGEGLRMKPVTCRTPKPLANLCGAPLISYPIEAIEKSGVPFSRKIISGGCFSRSLKAAVPNDWEFLGSDSENSELSALYSLNTGEDILISAGDTVSDCDIARLAEFHRENRSELTCALCECYDIRDKNLALLSENGEILSVIEKPSYYSCRTGLALCGTVIISGKALSEIISEDNRKLPECLETGLIPLFIRKKRPVFGIKCAEKFFDINTVNDLLACQTDMLFSGKFTETYPQYERMGVQIEYPCVIGKDVTFSEGVKIGAGSVIGDNVFMGRNARINGGFIGNGCYIGERASVSGGYICGGARLMTGASVFEGAAVGEKAVVGENAVVEPNVKIWSGREVEAETLVSSDVKYGVGKPVTIGEDGIWGDSGGSVDPQSCAVTGSALTAAAAEIRGKKRIAVGYRQNDASKALAFAVMSGISAAGGEVSDIGGATAEETAFAVRKAELSAGCYVDAGVTARVSLISSDGLPLKRHEERIVEAGLNRGDYPKNGFPRFGGIQDMSSISELYKLHISALCKAPLNGVRVRISSSDDRICKLGAELLAPVNSPSGREIVFSISSDGRKASAYSEESGYVFWERLVMIAAIKAFSEGRTVSLPCEFPAAADKLAEKYRGTVLRYGCCPTDNSDDLARAAAFGFPEVRDGLALALSVSDYLSREGISLNRAAELLPKYASAARFIPIDRSSRALRGLSDVRSPQSSDEGIMLDESGSRVFIRPVKTGRGLMMYVESMSIEAASEICDFYEEKLVREDKFSTPD